MPAEAPTQNAATELSPRSPLPLHDWPDGEWYYEPNEYLEHRYILGRPGTNPLVCVGINPSTARPGALDNTLKSVERLARANGFDGWVMFNVYPQRATDPNDMNEQPNLFWHRQNLAWLRRLVCRQPVTMWAAWGTLIEKRPYLSEFLREMAAVTAEYDCPWVSFGRISKAGHPHHPLYLRRDETPAPFDLATYLETLEAAPPKRRTRKKAADENRQGETAFMENVL